jgi:glycosyltransferase involved in cell wall biosynthesis
MNVWILNHYADTPDRQATRSYDLGWQLVEKGHHVTIFAAGFNHYSLKEERVPPGKTWHEEDWNGVRFVWLKTFPYGGNDWRRILNMLSYAWNAFWVGKAMPEKPAAVIGTSVHPLAALAAYVLARVRRSRFFFEVTDLWPETLIEFGRLRRYGLSARLLRAIEKFLYRHAEKIIMLLGHTHKYVASLGESPAKIVWIPNGVDLSRYTGLRPYDGTFSRTFTIMYLGGLVASNNVDVILEAAKILDTRDHGSARFVFVGDGTDKARLVKRAQDFGLRNTEFRGLVPKTKIAEVMSEADAFVFSLQNLSLYKYGISLNKMCDYLASGRPILFAGDSTYNPIREARAGICVPPDNPVALADAVIQLISLPAAERAKMGQRGLGHLKKFHDIRVLADRLERVLLRQPIGEGTENPSSTVPELRSDT